MKTLNELFTLVVMTHNRQRFLLRTMEYYRGFTGRILILDSSAESAAPSLSAFPGVEYHHLPEYGYWGAGAKLAYGVGLIETPFMCFAADDDFLLHDALEQSVRFLEEHPEYGLCHGYGMMYVARGTEVNFYRRDKRVHEDYDSESPDERVVEFMGQFLPPFYAVTRTDLIQQWFSLIPLESRFEWHEIGHSFFLLASAKARILPIPFAVREANMGGSEHNTDVLRVLALQDAKSIQEREQFAEFLAGLPTPLSKQGFGKAKEVALQAFKAMSDGLMSGRALHGCMIVRSLWRVPDPEPVRIFGEQQFVEMPFYNKPMFDFLARVEFLIHTMPCGRIQLAELESILVRQQALMQVNANDNERTIRARLWQALALSPFNRVVVERLLASLESAESNTEAAPLRRWLANLESMPSYDSEALLDSMHSGQLLNWLKAREPDHEQVRLARLRLAEAGGGASFGIVLLDLDAQMDKLQATFDSLMAGPCRNFKVVVLTSGDLPMATNAEQTVHFVKVDGKDHTRQINQAVAQLGTDWVVLAEAGDRFTASGLLRASLELLGAEGIRAVAMDEVQVQADGRLREVLRPGTSLDLLQSVPGVMARHWLLRRDLLLAVGGFDSQYPQALEFDLLLRLIGEQGLAGLAHLAEPLLICAAPTLDSQDQEHAVLTRRLAERGYAATVGSVHPGTHQIDYRHVERPLVSILLHCQDNADDLQRCLVSVLQRTRYQNHEILIADNASQSPQLREWLASLEAAGNRVRVIRSEQALAPMAMLNLASQEALGEYLVMLDSAAEVLNANWLEGLLNQAQRPEVGVVGCKLLGADGKVVEAGLVLAGEAGIRPAFEGAAKDAPGYLQRLQVEHNVSAVSGCLMVRAEVLQALGGLDEQLMGLRAAQADLCLQVGGAGLLVVWTPQAQVVRHGQVDDLACAPGSQDPFYNAGHSRSAALFSLDADSRVEWQALCD